MTTNIYQKTIQMVKKLNKISHITNCESESSVNERIKLIVESLNITANAFAQELNVAGSVVYNIIKGRNKPSFDILDKIVSSFNVSPNFLLTGKGNMFSSNDEISQIENQRTGDTDDDYIYFLKQWEKINKITEKVGKKDLHSYFDKVSWSLEYIAEITKHYSLMEQSINFLRFAPKNIDNKTLTSQVLKMLDFEEELSLLIKSHEAVIAKLYKDISAFNEKHDNIYHMDEDYFEDLLREVDKEMNTPKD